MAGWDDMLFGNLPQPRYRQPATPGAQMPVLTDDGSTWPQTQPAAPQAGQGQGGGYLWPQILQGLWNTAKSGVTLPGDVATGKASMADPATQGRVGDMASVAMLGAGAAPAEPDALNMGIRAYHGSPHSFDRFDISKIGTGEGAQAYGHGLYFAGNEDVARSYKSAGQPYYLNDERRQAAQDFLDKAGGDRNAALALAQQDYERANKYGFGDERKTQDIVNNFDTLISKPPGSMYQVDINADPEKFLDWDKPLSEQHPTVENAAADLAAKMRQPMGNATGEAFYQNLIAAHQAESGNLPIGDASARGASRASAASAISERLRDAGVPGIKYLDQGSRGADAGTGTHNYVTFSDDIVNILKKYGLAGLGLTAGAGAVATQRPSPADAAQAPLGTSLNSRRPQ